MYSMALWNWLIYKGKHVHGLAFFSVAVLLSGTYTYYNAHFSKSDSAIACNQMILIKLSMNDGATRIIAWHDSHIPG